MEDLLSALYSAYSQPWMREHVMSLIKRGPEEMGIGQLQMGLTCSSACLIRLSQKRHKLSSTQRAILERLLGDERLQQELRMFVADLRRSDEPARLLAALQDHAPVVVALENCFAAVLDECGCDL